MAVHKLTLHVDKATFLNIASKRCNKLWFAQTRIWQGKLEAFRTDIEGNLVPRVYESVILHWIQGTEHHIVERKVNDIRAVTIPTKRKYFFRPVGVPYYEVSLGHIIKEEESKDKHMDFNRGKGFQWRR